MTKKKKKIVIIMGILFIILMITLIMLVNLMFNIRTSKQNLRYMNSDELDKGTFSPKMIHILIASYEGDVNPKAISKATYYLVKSRIPEYVKKCSNDEETKKYYHKNAEDINIDIGINSEEEFMKLIKEINKLSGNLIYESSTFKKDEITVNKNDTEAMLYIQYKNNPEISIKTTISNKVYTNKTSVMFSK